ncbi:MAG: response regulator, partial [Nitrospirae bacterium]
LTQTRDFLRSIFEGIGDALVVVDPDFRIISANRGYLNQTALKEEDIGRVYCYQVSHRYSQPCFREGEDCPVYKTLLEGTPQRAVHEHFGADGELIYVEIVSYPLRDTEGKIYAVVETLRDITEMKRLERESLELKSQLMQAQKMEAIGTLAAGIAHDFNNMLLGINGFAEMLMNRLSDPDLKDKAERILDIVDRASRLTEQILIIGRKVKYNKKPLQLNRFISHSLETLRRMIEENIELKVKLEKDLPLIEVDEAQLYQVLLNLIVNARDELRQKGGEIVIRTGKRSVSDSLGLRQGEYVFFSVKDNGGGIAENIKDRIFEPFFSTKPKGEGTGLGLSVVYSIVKDHGGFIDLSSKPGRGAEFTVFFPATKEAEERPEREGETEKQEISGHGRRVLVAEDEEVIRDFLSACLSEWGFEVVVASTGDEALALFQQSPEDFDLVLLDKVMPGLSGTEAFRMMKKQNPSLRAIICTGYASAEVLSDTSREGAFVLKKPFRMQDLKRAIGEVFSS